MDQASPDIDSIFFAALEKTSPEAHQDFLASIGIDKEEIILIRQWSRPDNPGE